MKTKILNITLSCLVCLSFLLINQTNAFASTDKLNAWMTVDSDGQFYYDSSDNGDYYHLTYGRASIDVSSKSGGGTAYLTLYRERTGPDKKIDTVEVNGEGHYTFYGCDTDSSKYYIVIQGGGYQGSSVHVGGTVNDWA